jgi:hypothetical protein
MCGLRQRDNASGCIGSAAAVVWLVSATRCNVGKA